MLLPPLFAASVAIFSRLPSVIGGILFLLLFLTQSLTLAWLILLKDETAQYKRYFKENHINIDLDAHYEATNSFNEKDP